MKVAVAETRTTKRSVFHWEPLGFGQQTFPATMHSALSCNVVCWISAFCRWCTFRVRVQMLLCWNIVGLYWRYGCADESEWAFFVCSCCTRANVTMRKSVGSACILVARINVNGLYLFAVVEMVEMFCCCCSCFWPCWYFSVFLGGWFCLVFNFMICLLNVSLPFALW